MKYMIQEKIYSKADLLIENNFDKKSILNKIKVSIDW